MSKGIPAAKSKSLLDRCAKLVVPVGAKVFPDTVCSEFPEGISIPDGLRIRTERGVEVRFLYEGERMSETVRGVPTVAFVREVARKRERVQQLIGLGKFGLQEYAEEFPESRKVKAAKAVEEKRPVTVGEALDEWYQTQLETMESNTASDHIRAIRNQLMPLQLPSGLFKDSDYLKPRPDYTPPASWSESRYNGGPVRPVDVKNTKILAHLPVHLLTDLAISKIREAIGREVSPKRVNNLMAPLRGALERQEFLENIPKNPFKMLKSLKKSKVKTGKDGVIDNLNAPLPKTDATGFILKEGKVDPFDKSEVLRILQHLDAPMANHMVFAFWTGLRTGETIALRTNDIDFENDRICVRRSLSRGLLKGTKTDKERWVQLLPPAKEAMLAQIKLLGAPDGWVFPNPFTRKRWANDSKITKRWKNALEKAGVRYRRPYQTRHTFASMMLSAGENVMYVAGQLGHVDWSMVVRVYGHWAPSGAVNVAGNLVATANTNNWGDLVELLAKRSEVVPLPEDYEADDELEDEELVESDDLADELVG